MKAFNPKTTNIRVSIDTENIDVSYLLHIYNFRHLPQEIQEGLIDFIPDKVKNPQPAILCIGEEDSGNLRHYIAPHILTEFCSNHKTNFSINLAPSVHKYLGYIHYSCSHPPYTREDVITNKFANSIVSGSVTISFGQDEVIFFCNVGKNFRVEDFYRAFGFEMNCEQSNQGNVDVFRLSPRSELGINLHHITGTVFSNFGNLLLNTKDLDVLNVLKSHLSRGRQ